MPCDEIQIALNRNGRAAVVEEALPAAPSCNEPIFEHRWEGRETSPGTWLNDPALRRRKKINGWPLRDNSRRVDRAMAAVTWSSPLRYAWNLVQGRV
jgi:hypothetical protein